MHKEMEHSVKLKVIDSLIRYLDQLADEDMSPVKSTAKITIPKKEVKVEAKAEEMKEDKPKMEDAESMFETLLKKKKKD